MDSRRLSVLLLEDSRRNIVGCGRVTGDGSLGNRIWRLLVTKGRGKLAFAREIEGL
jgi:hypothetical protein